jgi:predicted dehydrogenase
MSLPVTSDRPIRWGILGAGGIAATVGADMLLMPGNVVHAVGARDHERAKVLAAKLGAKRAYGSYQALVDDPAVDVIYVATTHGQHEEHALLALNAGKPVLVEKAFTLNARQARTVVAVARARGLFCMEAMWLRCHPLIRQAVHLVQAGRIGSVLSVRADLSAFFAFDPLHRLFDLSAGGGALLDLGVYPSHFAWLFLGRPDTVATTGELSPTGSDATTAMQWGYRDGRFAQLACSTRARNPLTGLIAGTDGWISIDDRLHRPTGITVSSFGVEQVLTAPEVGYQPEIAEVERCLRAGELESPLMPLDETIAILDVLDQARAELGVRYAADAENAE